MKTKRSATASSSLPKTVRATNNVTRKFEVFLLLEMRRITTKTQAKMILMIQTMMTVIVLGTFQKFPFHFRTLTCNLYKNMTNKKIPKAIVYNKIRIFTYQILYILIFYSKY